MSDDEAPSLKPQPQPLPAQDAVASKEQGEAILEALWGRVLEAWDDDKPHQALLEYAIRSQKLPDLAGRYRAVKERDPEKAVRAQKKLDGIVITATQMLMAMKSPPDRFKVPASITLTVFAICLLLLGWLGYGMFHRR